VASGRNWPDALAAVPHAARAGGPILLTFPDSLPGITETELTRLKPGRIVVVGGPGAVSPAVATALDAYDTGGGVTRIGGADRYETAAAMSAAHFSGTAPYAYVATGQNFPDALAAGPAAALRGAPTILVRAGSIPAAAATELERLNPTHIYVVGGPFIVGGGVAAQVLEYADG
jgi:putative cell wall-binding protein